MSVLDALRDKAQTRAEKFKTYRLRKLPNPNYLHEWATIGTYSYFLMQTKQRLTLRSGLLSLGHNIKETISSVARDYINIEYKQSPTIKHAQAEIFKAAYIPPNSRIKNAPQYFDKKITFDHGYYIDIISTYWSVINITGWNVDYWPGRWLASGKKPDNFPFPDHKTARSCLVSVARPGSVLLYNPEGRNNDEKFPTKPVGSKILNLGISLLIADVLHSIAYEAQRAGAVYINADGYIAPNEKVAGHIAQIIYDWGLPAAIKAEGSGEVLGIGNYKVGLFESEPHADAWERGRETQAHEQIKKIENLDYAAWLQPRFARYAAGRKV